MKVVLDTNVYLSAFLFKDIAAKAFEKCVFHHDIYVSQWILDEVQEKLTDKFQLNPEEIQEVLDLIKTPAEVVLPTNPLPAVCRDADDNYVLQLAESVDADLLLTGDKDLLVLEELQIPLNPLQSSRQTRSIAPPGRSKKRLAAQRIQFPSLARFNILE